MAGMTTTRRRILQLGGAAAWTGMAGRLASAAGNEPIRVGAVLPMRTGLSPIGDATSYQAVADAAFRGVTMGGEEYSANAAMLGMDLKVLVATAPSPEAAQRAAARMVSRDGVFALIGGFGTEDTLAVGELAEQRKVPFFNIAASSDSLRGSRCNRYMFHVEASAAMYLDAMAAWYIRSGFRRYFFVRDDSDEQQARYEHMLRSLDQRHFGGREVGSATVQAHRPLYVDALKQIAQAKPDVVVLLLDAVDQLDFMGQYETSDLPDVAISGFPTATAQTRAFYAASRNASTRAGSNFRAALFEPSLDNYGARELNARFLDRWNEPMDASAWAGYEAVKMLYEAAAYSGSRNGPDVVDYLERKETTFDVHKGIGVSFRPWDHQLRQTLYLVKINADAQSAMDLAALVGELPEIYKPGTDPVERLDQIGVLQRATPCSLGSL